ncbi:hypothetical protein I3760_01G148500 [Carya illinoinensis]|nr:hypothetical protein I3760_01G148500 [Carya illinoinensis]
MQTKFGLECNLDSHESTALYSRLRSCRNLHKLVAIYGVSNSSAQFLTSSGRSSVVSVLISLISDTWSNGPHDIKLIFLGGGPATAACCWGLRASPMRCTIARARRTPPNTSSKRFSQVTERLLQIRGPMRHPIPCVALSQPGSKRLL